MPLRIGRTKFDNLRYHGLVIAMPKPQTQPVAVITTVRIAQLRIVEVFPQLIPIFTEISPGKWAKAA